MKTTIAATESTFSGLVHAAGLGFEPELQAMFLADGSMVDGKNAVVRPMANGERQVLGVVGARYVPTSYATIGETLDAPGAEGEPSLGSLVTPHSAIEFGGGAKVVLQGRINGGEVDLISPRNGRIGVAAFISAVGSLDGSSGLSLLPSGHCIVCKNTLALAVARDVWKMSTKHTAGGQARFVGYVRAVAAALAAFRVKAEAYQRMVNTPLSEAGFRTYIETVFPARSAVEQVLEATPATPSWTVADILGETEAQATGHRGKLVSALLDAYESAPGAEPGTVWGAYQAATHYLTHTAGRGEEARAHSLTFGPNRARVELAEATAVRLLAR